MVHITASQETLGRAAAQSPVSGGGGRAQARLRRKKYHKVMVFEAPQFVELSSPLGWAPDIPAAGRPDPPKPGEQLQGALEGSTKPSQGAVAAAAGQLSPPAACSPASSQQPAARGQSGSAGEPSASAAWLPPRAAALLLVAVVAAALLLGRLAAFAAATCAMLAGTLLRRAERWPSRLVPGEQGEQDAGPPPELVQAADPGQGGIFQMSLPSAALPPAPLLSSPSPLPSPPAARFLPHKIIAGFMPPPPPLVLLPEPPESPAQVPPPASSTMQSGPPDSSDAVSDPEPSGHLPVRQVSAPCELESPAAAAAASALRPPPAPLPRASSDPPSPGSALLFYRHNRRRRRCNEPHGELAEPPSPHAVQPGGGAAGADGGRGPWVPRAQTQSGPLLPSPSAAGGGRCPPGGSGCGEELGHSWPWPQAASGPIPADPLGMHSEPFAGCDEMPKGGYGRRGLRRWGGAKLTAARAHMGGWGGGSPRAGARWGAAAARPPPAAWDSSQPQSPPPTPPSVPPSPSAGPRFGPAAGKVSSAPKLAMLKLGGLLKTKAAALRSPAGGGADRAHFSGGGAASTLAPAPAFAAIAAARPINVRRGSGPVPPLHLPRAAILRSQSVPVSPTLHAFKPPAPSVVRVVEKAPAATTTAATVAATVPVSARLEVGGVAAEGDVSGEQGQAAASASRCVERERRRALELRVVTCVAVLVVLCSLFLGRLPAIVATSSVGIMVARIRRRYKPGGGKDAEAHCAPPGQGLPPCSPAGGPWGGDSRKLATVVEEEGGSCDAAAAAAAAAAAVAAAAAAEVLSPRSPIDAILQHSSATDPRTQAILAGLLDRSSRSVP